MTMIPILKMFKIDPKIDPKNWPLKLFVKLSQPTLRYYSIQDFVVCFPPAYHQSQHSASIYVITTPMCFIYCIQCAVCSVCFLYCV